MSVTATASRTACRSATSTVRSGIGSASGLLDLLGRAQHTPPGDAQTGLHLPEVTHRTGWGADLAAVSRSASSRALPRALRFSPIAGYVRAAVAAY